MQYEVEFVTFLLEKNTNQWQRAYVECRSLDLPLLTWEQFYTLLLKKYVRRALCDNKNDEFLALEQGDILVAAYKDKFHALSYKATQLLAFEQKRIHLYVKGLNYDLQVLFIHMNFIEKGFNDV